MSENISADLIFKYFPNLSEEQRRQFEALDALYHDWNAKINVISRKDIDNLYPHHVLHSLGILTATAFSRSAAVPPALRRKSTCRRCGSSERNFPC